MMWYMEFIFGRAGAALLSPCHGEGQDVRRRQCDFRVTAKCAPQSVPFSCHGKMCTAGSAIFVSRQNVRRGQCDFRVTASLPPRAVPFSCHGKMCAAGRKQTAAPSGYAGFRRLSASIQNACPRKARASGILNRFAVPTIPHAVLTTTKTAPKAIKLW